MFTEAAFRCGAQLTRACVLQQLKTMPTFSAGGYASPKEPRDQTPYRADLLMQVQGGRFIEIAKPAGAKGPAGGPDFWDNSDLFNWRQWYCANKSRFINTAAKDRVISC